VSEPQFIAEAAPSDTLCAALEVLYPTIPYYTRQYRDAMQAFGKRVWLLGVEVDGHLALGCLGELQGGRLSRELHVQSTPSGADPTFWAGLLHFCKAERVTHLSLGTVGTNPSIPVLGRPLSEKVRREYWVNLDVPDPKNLVRPEQRRIFNRAVDAGMTLRQVTAAEGLATHRQLTSASLGRRRARGEEIPHFADSGIPRALLATGAARMYEGLLDGKVVGSVILTVASAGAHGYSAGFAPEGLKAGAGVFVNLSTFGILKAEGRLLFNLGDAPPDSGLALFKKGLGGEVHESRAGLFHVGGVLHRGLLELRSRVEGALDSVRRRVGATPS
jgi:hypothetical protein